MMNTNKPVEVVSTTDSAGIIKPIFLYLTGEEGIQSFPIERLIRRDREKIDGKAVITFTCEILLDNMKRLCDIRYDEASDNWTLLRMQ